MIALQLNDIDLTAESDVTIETVNVGCRTLSQDSPSVSTSGTLRNGIVASVVIFF